MIAPANPLDQARATHHRERCSEFSRKECSMQDRSKLAEPVLEQLADAVICADRSGVIVRWNRASIALFWLLVGRGARPESRSGYSWTTLGRSQGGPRPLREIISLSCSATALR